METKEEVISMKKPAYPVLAQLMAKHGLNKGDISNVIGLSYRNTLKKLNGERVFNLVEAGKVVKSFIDLGESVTIDDIFFA